MMWICATKEYIRNCLGFYDSPCMPSSCSATMACCSRKSSWRPLWLSYRAQSRTGASIDGNMFSGMTWTIKCSLLLGSILAIPSKKPVQAQKVTTSEGQVCNTIIIMYETCVSRARMGCMRLMRFYYGPVCLRSCSFQLPACDRT